VASALQEHGTAGGDELATIMDYLHAVVLHVPFADTAQRRTSWTTRFDVEAWEREGSRRPLSAYVFDAPRTFRAEAEADRQALILSKVRTFGEHPSGLGKFTRTLFARDLRRTLAHEPVAPGTEPG